MVPPFGPSRIRRAAPGSVQTMFAGPVAKIGDARAAEFKLERKAGDTL